jgi:hypothetical protein
MLGLLTNAHPPTRGRVFTDAQRRTRRFTSTGRGNSAKSATSNDPNAGSPTITLLRLLLPLGRAIIWTLVGDYARRKASAQPHPPNP